MEKAISLPEKPFLTLEEAANKIGCNPSQLLEYAFIRETQEQRFGQLRVHAIFHAEILKKAKISFTSRLEKPFSHSNFFESPYMDALLETFDNSNLNSEHQMPEVEINEQIEEDRQEYYALEDEQLKLSDYADYHPDVTITPKNFVLLDIETLIQIFNSEIIDVSRAYLEGFEEELVELDFSRLENRTQISKNNLRVFSSDIDKLIKTQNGSIENASEEPMTGKERNYILAIVGVLIHGYKWSVDDKDIVEKIMKLSQSEGCDFKVIERTVQKYIEILQEEHSAYWTK